MGLGAGSSDKVWPALQTPPANEALNKLRCSLASVATAARWSGSTEWRKPRTKPKPKADKADICGSNVSFHINISILPRKKPVAAARPR